MNTNFNRILDEKLSDLFKNEKNTFGGEDLKIVNDAIHYMKYIKSYSKAISTGEWLDPVKENNSTKVTNQTEIHSEDIQIIEASVPKPKDTENLKKGFFNKDDKTKWVKLLNSAVIKYQELYQKMFQLLGKYSQLQKIYGPYNNNNQMYANMFDCPTWEERKGLGKFPTDDQIFQNLNKFKENLKKVINTTQSDEDANVSSDQKYQKTVSNLMKDNEISAAYKPEQLRTILKNLDPKGSIFKLESVEIIGQLLENDLDLNTKYDKRYQVLKKLLISYAQKGEEQILKLLKPENAGKIVQYIYSQSTDKKIEKPDQEQDDFDEDDLKQTADSIKNELGKTNTRVAKKTVSFINTLMQELDKAQDTSQSGPAEKDDGINLVRSK